MIWRCTARGQGFAGGELLGACRRDGVVFVQFFSARRQELPVLHTQLRRLQIFFDLGKVRVLRFPVLLHAFLDDQIDCIQKSLAEPFFLYHPQRQRRRFSDAKLSEQNGDLLELLFKIIGTGLQLQPDQTVVHILQTGYPDGIAVDNDDAAPGKISQTEIALEKVFEAVYDSRGPLQDPLF